ncbi:hypothetical protein K469DRAFT_561430 [Zopfia rhizophila CBS 207.26]|uniref:Uncharacterized protein n=1 Tax=Zopfia rhizophila CBS 207.26 TaxID=1314779 RepID=A0A6A6EFF9_9PEZI|nr:hypothetical protein K469DRAFT_561430 [Zopfia rhizophila CBS 207.26]
MPLVVPQLTRRTSRSSGSQSGCRSSRIEKPRSNHNSPMALERRKTTLGTKRYATLDDHYNMMFGLTGGEEETVEDRREPARPFSWHPSTQFQFPSRSTRVELTPSQNKAHHYSDSSRNSTHGSDFYSLSARSSMYPEQTRNFSTHLQSQETNRGSQSSDSSWQDVSQPGHSYALSSYSTPSTEPLPWYLQEWARKAQAKTSNSGPGSTDFLPIQHPSAEHETDSIMEDDDMEDSGKELVGMGLYDLPDTALSWNSSGLVEGTGKGLKLEETWQPPENEDEEEDADDASSDDGSMEELPAKESEQLPLNTKPQLPTNMEGQSFFFDEDETYTKEWWFQQLKQPTVRDTGLGYGWL